MIVNNPTSHFIFVFSGDHVKGKYNYINYKGKPLTNKEYLQYWGKWLIFGSPEELGRLAEKLNPFVESKKIPAAKYDREIIAEFDLGECVMCVYCDLRQRDEIWEILTSLGIEDKAWAFERETMERWLPGGHLLEKWIKGRGMSAEQAEQFRAYTKEKFRRMFEDEDAIFTGIEQ